MSKGSKGSKPKKPNGWKYMTPWERVRNLVGLSIFLVPTVYGTAWVLLSTQVNRAFHHTEQCTITAIAGQRSGARSYSSSSDIYLQSPDCSDLVFKGKQYGLADSEVVDRIGGLMDENPKMLVDVGVWQVPFSPTVIVGIEGLDLSK
ncbi:hypothetical protein [Rothia nasisuis]|uniref:hypothetical protein n=1 Tax=Rothia nasisuis TaxID=2109647 RepID=UPI001F345DB5|nr:hypothetical protein [Rothia nasisuis]